MNPRGTGPLAEDLSRCVHCGLCLSSCPTYLETGLEAESPRGRIALMRAVSEGVLPLTSGVAGHLESCVQCRACEDVCPSGVPYGRMMEAERERLRTHRPPGNVVERLFDGVFYRWLLPNPGNLRLVGRIGTLAHRLGLIGLARRLRLGGRLSDFIPSPEVRYLQPRYEPAGTPRGTVAILEGCIMPLTLPAVNEATVRVCTGLGYQVVNPAGQVCCGALHAHRGYLDQARDLARVNIAAFLETGAEVVVVNSAGCGAAMKEYGELLHGDPEWAARAAEFSSRVRDVSEFAVAAGPPGGDLPARVTYQESCHLGHAQRVKQQPRRALRAIDGLELCEMAEADLCCGSGGVYTIMHPQMSAALLDRTIENVRAVNPDVLVTANPGCILQLQAGVRRAGLAIPVRHVVEVLDEAMQARSGVGQGQQRPPNG